MRVQARGVSAALSVDSVPSGVGASGTATVGLPGLGEAAGVGGVGIGRTAVVPVGHVVVLAKNTTVPTGS